MKLRSWIDVITVILLALAVFFGRHQIVQAWGLIGRVDLRFYLLILPIQLLSYYAVGEVMFSYLRSKGDILHFTRRKMARIALELNFVNHIIPVPSIAGFSYLGWVLGRDNVSAGRATMAQIIRYVMMFASFMIMILLSVIALAFDQGVDRTIINITAILTVMTIISASLLIYFMSNLERLIKVSNWLTGTVNGFINLITFGKKNKILVSSVVEGFFIELHQDYLEIRQDKKILLKPFLWAVFSNVLDVGLISVAFLALGFWVNPATLFIALGVSSFAAIFAATPGGSGIYEAIMIAFLVSAGIPADVAIAGTLLARVTLFAGTILFGFIFYQLTINKYGRIEKPNL